MTVVFIHSEERSRGKWPVGIVKQLYTGRGGDITQSTSREKLNPEAPVFRTKRNAAVAASQRIQQQLDDEDD